MWCYLQSEAGNVYTKNTKTPPPDFCAFCVRFLTLVGGFSRGRFSIGRPKTRTQKTQKSGRGIFVFFVYVFWEFGSHFRKVVLK